MSDSIDLPREHPDACRYARLSQCAGYARLAALLIKNNSFAS